ncbi:MAG: CBS domain-containing protein [bacterium]|nr:CBS domain-containing protein [bacterium]
MTANEMMTQDVVSVSTEMDLRDLAKLFLSKGITGAPVVDTEGNLAGVISQTDLIYYSLQRDDELVLDSHFYQNARVEGRHLPKGFQVEDCNTGIVADVMTPVVHSVSERASLESVARMMTRKHIHRVIVKRGRKVAGVISALDVLRAQAKERRAAARKTPAAKRKTPAAKRKTASARAVKAR